jgi:hypothetical protein
MEPGAGAAGTRVGEGYKVTLAPDLITGLASFLFTVLIFSYLLRDNPLFRIATYLFVGGSAGYIATVAWWQVLWPNLLSPLAFGRLDQRILLVIPLLGSGLLLMKIWPPLGRLGSPAMAYLVGVGAAAAIGGALIGTLIPQIAATINAFDMQSAAVRQNGFLEIIWNGAFILTGTVTSLAYFHFGARAKADGSIKRAALIEILAFIGRIFIAITLGVLFAGVYASALTALIERLSSIIQFLGSL